MPAPPPKFTIAKPIVLQGLTKEILFDYTGFIDELSSNDIEMARRSIQIVITRSEMDLSILADKLLEKSMSDGDAATYARLSYIIDDETRSSPFPRSFKDIFVSSVIKALGREVTGSAISEGRNAEAAAEILSEIYKIGWLNNNQFFHCIDEIANTQFNTIRQIRAFRGLLKPAIMKIMRSKTADDERFLLYLQVIRSKVSGMPQSKNQLICLELVELLETITAI
jgi:hypothetical protein